MEGSGHFMLIGRYKQNGEGGGKEPMGAVIGMGVWGLDPVRVAQDKKNPLHVTSSGLF